MYVKQPVIFKSAQKMIQLPQGNEYIEGINNNTYMYSIMHVS